MTEQTIRRILTNHKHWLNRDCENWEGMKAVLSDTNLYNVNLRDANLRYANISYSDLSYSDLSYSNLHYANLSYTDLNCTDLCYVDLSCADLHDAKLHCADLHGANLRDTNLNSSDLSGSDLSGTNLNGAKLIGADLNSADLRYADLHNADLRNADLYNANLYKATNIPFIPLACPEYGSFIGFKKAHNKIVVLEIQADAKRSSATSRKCRCNKAKVIAIQELDGENTELKEISSNYNEHFVYRVGEIVEEPEFDDDRWNECSKGIHFFINRQDAVEY